MGFAQKDCAEATKLYQAYLLNTADGKPDFHNAYLALQNCVVQGDASVLVLQPICVLADKI